MKSPEAAVDASLLVIAVMVGASNKACCELRVGLHNTIVVAGDYKILPGYNYMFGFSPQKDGLVMLVVLRP